MLYNVSKRNIIIVTKEISGHFIHSIHSRRTSKKYNLCYTYLQYILREGREEDLRKICNNILLIPLWFLIQTSPFNLSLWRWREISRRSHFVADELEKNDHLSKYIRSCKYQFMTFFIQNVACCLIETVNEKSEGSFISSASD